jgi:hypothetical protein
LGQSVLACGTTLKFSPAQRDGQVVLDLETEFADFERQTLRTITAEQKRQILQLAGDFPRL